MKERIRLLILKLLGLEPIIRGLRTDLQAHAQAMGQVSLCQQQLEEKFGIRRIAVPGEHGPQIVLVTRAEQRTLRRDSRDRAWAQKQRA